MAQNLPLERQPNFRLISAHIHGAADEIEKCSNFPAVQDGFNIVQILRGIQGLLNAMNRRFDEIDRRFDGIDKRLDGIDKRFDGLVEDISYNFAHTNERFDGITNRLDDMDKRSSDVSMASIHVSTVQIGILGASIIVLTA